MIFAGFFLLDGRKEGFLFAFGYKLRKNWKGRGQPWEWGRLGLCLQGAAHCLVFVNRRIKTFIWDPLGFKVKDKRMGLDGNELGIW